MFLKKTERLMANMRENLSKHKKLKLEMDFQNKDEGGV